jgi:hypothetical protein
LSLVLFLSCVVNGYFNVVFLNGKLVLVMSCLKNGGLLLLLLLIFYEIV